VIKLSTRPDAKFEIEKAKTRVCRNIAISQRIVPARVGNSGSPTAIQKVLQISGIGGFNNPLIILFKMLLSLNAINVQI